MFGVDLLVIKYTNPIVYRALKIEKISYDENPEKQQSRREVCICICHLILHIIITNLLLPNM